MRSTGLGWMVVVRASVMFVCFPKLVVDERLARVIYGGWCTRLDQGGVHLRFALYRQEQS